MCTHLQAPVLEGLLWSPSVFWPRIREQQGPLNHLRAALQPVLVSLRAQEPSPAWIPTKEPQFVVQTVFGSRQRRTSPESHGHM